MILFLELYLVVSTIFKHQSQDIFDFELSVYKSRNPAHCGAGGAINRGSLLAPANDRPIRAVASSLVATANGHIAISLLTIKIPVKPY